MSTAAEAEATGVDLTVEWDGFTIVLPASVDDWEIDALEAFETGRVATAVRGLLGSRRYDELRRDYQAKHGRKPTVGDFGGLVNEIAKIYGFVDLGE